MGYKTNKAGLQIENLYISDRLSELAVFDGRLESVKGVGVRRADSIRHSLNDMLTLRQPRLAQIDSPAPSVAEILSVDQEFRISEATETIFSNTASTYQYGNTREWVVINNDCDGDPKGQPTIVTEQVGHLRGMRVVRVRETACLMYDREQEDPQLRPCHTKPVTLTSGTGSC